MSRNKLAVAFASVLLLAVVFCLLRLQTPEEAENPLTVSAAWGMSREELTLWQDPAGDFYVFLPGCGDPADAVFRLEPGWRATIDGREISSGTNCAAFSLGTPYPFALWSADAETESTITFLRSSGVSTLFLDTQSGTMDYIHKDKDVTESAQLTIYTPAGDIDYQGKASSFGGRGNSSWSGEKKPYNLTLEEPGDLLGMGSAQRWILLANGLDLSGIRNKIAYDFARSLGMEDTPQTRWVELYLNGAYAGLYLLSERNEVHPNRVALDHPDAFLVSMELGERARVSDYPFVTTESGQYLRLHAYSGDIGGVEERLAVMERAILSDTGRDPVTGQHWQELIDTPSWVRKYLLEEFLANIDSGAVSQFFYFGIPGDTRIHAGPVWDYDLVLSTVDDPCIFYVNRYSLEKPEYPSWYYGLYLQESFYREVVACYRDVLLPLAHTLLDTGIDQTVREISGAMALNLVRYGTDPDSWAREIADIKDFLTQRIRFLNTVWLEEQPCCVVTLQVQGRHPIHQPVSPGEALGSLPQMPDTSRIRYGVWLDSRTGQPFDPDTPIYEDTILILSQEESLLSKLLTWLFPCCLGVAFLGLWAAESVVRRRWKKQTAPSGTSLST